MEARIVSSKLRKQTSRSNSRAERLLLPHMSIQFDQPSSDTKCVVETFVAERFSHHYQAEVTHFLPYLLSTKKDDTFTAAMGFHCLQGQSNHFSSSNT